MTIEQHNTRTEGYFIAKEGSTVLGQLFYSWAGIDKFVISHTEVKPEAKGTGTGQAMVEAAVKYARDNNFQIVPVCPFANAMFKKHKDWDDVLFK